MHHGRGHGGGHGGGHHRHHRRRPMGCCTFVVGMALLVGIIVSALIIVF